MKKVLLLAIVACSCLFTAAYGVPLRKMAQTPIPGTEETRSLLFDRHGLMWIGTDQGVRLYDGYRLKTFRSDAYTPDVLPNNYVLSLAEDHHEGIWIGTRDGLTRYDRRQGSTKTYHLKGEQARAVNALFVTTDGTVWAGTDAGASRYDAGKDDFVEVNMPYSARTFAEDAQGNLYIGTWEGGLLRLDKRSGKVVTYPRMNERNTVQSMLIDSRERLWIGTWEHGIVRLDRPADEHNPGMHHYNEGRQDFRTFHQLVEDSVSHSVWGCCIEGLTRIDLDDDSQVENHDGLKFCYDMKTDGHGNLWVVTRNDGIVHLSTKPSPFSFYPLDPAGQVLPVNRIQTVFTTDGNQFWLGLQPYGLARYDRLSGRVAYNNHIPGMEAMTGIVGIHVQTISAMMERRKGELWMASTRGILVWREGERVQLLPRNGVPYIIDGNVKALHRQDGVVWVGMDCGVGLAFVGSDDRETDLSAVKGRMLAMQEGGRDFSNCDVHAFMEDHRHRVWIATDHAGIICVSGDVSRPETVRCHQYASTRGNYPIDDAMAVFEDSRHRLWAVSGSGGLFLHNEEEDRFEVVNHRMHVNVSNFYSISGDAQDALWLLTDRGLLQLKVDDKGKCDPVYYSGEDGIDNIRFSANGVTQYGGEFFFGSAGGFFSCRPEQMQQWHPRDTAQLVVTELLIDDRPFERLDAEQQHAISTEQPFFTRRLSIPTDVDKFSIEFSLLSYQNQQQSNYSYQLEGYDHNWHYTDAENRKATYQNLPTGTYHLHVRAIDSYGNKVEMPYTIEIRVLPPWYQTWWAKLVYLALLTLLVYAISRWYKNYLKTKNRLAMGVILANITHELLTPLTVISASVDELRDQAPKFSENYGLIQNNINRLTRLLRQILEVRKSQAGQLKLLVSQSDLAAFVRKECDNIRPMVGSRSGELVVTCSPDCLDAWFDKDKMDKIVYNLLSNAVKYNREGGRIMVDLHVEGGKAVLCVSDEGIGMSKDKLAHLYTRFLDGDYRRMNTGGTGIGLSLTHDLVGLHHGKIHCVSQEGKGTTFTVTIPIRRDDYAEQEIDLTADSAATDAQQVEHFATIDDAEVADSADKEFSMLIVEDNSELLELMRRLFSLHYNVYTARNGEQALTIIHKRELDIVVTDVMMPVMDGIALTQAVKQSPDYGQLPVVMLTAKVTDEDKNAGFRTGADAYITKPFKLADLQLRIDSIIQNRERIRRKFSSQTEFNVEEQHFSSPDEVFIQQAIACVKDHLADSDYDRERFASDMCVSSSTLYNKLRALTGQSVTGFICSIRLKEACRLVRQQPRINVTELAMTVGFNTPKYFTKCFKKEFEMLPSEYIEKVQTGTAPTPSHNP